MNFIGVIRHCKLPKSEKKHRKANVEKITETISIIPFGPIMPRGRTNRGMITPIIH